VSIDSYNMKTTNTIGISNIKNIQYILFDFATNILMTIYLFDKNIKRITNQVDNKFSTTQ
jgi:hypothetical protein